MAGLLSGDVDGDGTMEVISHAPFAYQRGPLGLSFNPEYVLEGTYWSEAPSVDLTGDGIADVLLGRLENEVVYLIDGASPPSSVDAITTGWREVGVLFSHADVLSDIDGDGHAEVLVHTRYDTRVYLGPIAEGFLDRSAASYVLPFNSGTYVRADLDGDGRDDVVDVVNEGGGAYSLVLHLASDLFP